MIENTQKDIRKIPSLDFHTVYQKETCEVKSSDGRYVLKFYPVFRSYDGNNIYSFKWDQRVIHLSADWKNDKDSDKRNLYFNSAEFPNPDHKFESLEVLSEIIDIICIFMALNEGKGQLGKASIHLSLSPRIVSRLGRNLPEDTHLRGVYE